MAFAKKRSGENYGSFQKRTAWTAEEDEILKQQVARFGTHCWPEVAAGLAGRTSKACSLRWRCFLSPNIIRPNDEPFSPWEIAIIVLTQKVFGNKWNDIAAYLPMRCNNDIKNYFNLYLKEKGSVFTENCYLRSGYDLSQLLSHEPDEVTMRRQRLDAEKVANNIEAVKTPRSGSASPIARKPSTPKAKKSSSGSTSPSVRGGVAKGSGKPSRMGLASASLSAMMSEGYCMDGSYAAYSADAAAMYGATPDMAAAAAAAATASQAYMAGAHMDSPGMYGSQAVAGYYSSAGASNAAGYSYADGAEYGMQLAAHSSGSYAELHAAQQQQQQTQQQPALACLEATSDPTAAAAAAAAVGSMPGSYSACNGLFGPASGSGSFEAMLPPADKCAASTPALHASKPTGLLRNSSSGGGSPNASSIYSPLMRFSIGDPDNILGPDVDANDPIAAAMGVHWHRITSMDGTDFDSLLSDGCEMQAEYHLNKMLAEYEPSVTSKPHSQGGSAGPATGVSPPRAAKHAAEHTQHSTQQSVQQSMQQAQGDVSEGIDPAAAAAAPQDIPQLLMRAGLGMKVEPTAASVAAHLAALVAPAGFRGEAAAAATSSAGAAAAAAAACAGAHLQPNLHVDVPSPSLSGGPCSHQHHQQQQQTLLKYETAVNSPPEAAAHHLSGSSGGTGSSGGNGSPATTHLSHVNINLGLVNPAIAHLIAGGERNATSAPCTMVAAYTPNGSYNPNPALPKGAFTQGPPQGWQQLQQQQSSQQLLQQQPQQQVHMGAGSRLSPFNNLQHQQQQLQGTGDAWGAATPTCTSQQQQHLSSGMYSAASSPHQMPLHLPHHHLQQHLQASSMHGSPATPTAASGAGVYASPLRNSSAPAWNSSSPGVHSSQQLLQQQHSAVAAAAAAINCTARWSQAQDGSLPLEPTHEEEAELVTLLHVEADADVAMTDAAPPGSAGGNAPAHSMAAAGGSGPLGLFERAVGAASAQDQAKLESLIQELQTGAATDSRLGGGPMAEAGDLMEMPAWRSSSSGCLGLLPNDCW